MLIGWLQVLPSSSLLTSISWAVLSADIPGMEFHQARPFSMPCVQAATIQIVFVFSYTRIDDIVHAQKRPVVGRYQPRNTVGRSPVVTGVADTDSHAADI